VARAEPAALEHDRFVFELRQLGDLERFQGANLRFHAPDPAGVELVPVLVVMTAATLEELGPPGQLGLVAH
jgi:hypothetical protein